jgi:hypothetical protein
MQIDDFQATRPSRARFKNALGSVVTTPRNLVTLIERCAPGPLAARRALKLGWWIDAGYTLGREIDSAPMVGFFSVLSGDEPAMTDSAFAHLWSPAAAARLKASRIRRGVIPDPRPKVRKKRKANTSYLARLAVGNTVLGV